MGFLKKFIFIVVLIAVVFLLPKNARAEFPYGKSIQLTPVPCYNDTERGDPDSGGIGSVNPTTLCSIYQNRLTTSEKSRLKGQVCPQDYADFASAPDIKHYWAEDPEVTAQGHADERAREFLAWTLNTRAVDDFPPLKFIWGHSRNIALILTVLVAAILGLGLIIGQRMQFDLKVQVWPAVFKIASALLYITFSATIVILLVQLSEVMMRFFTERLGSQQLFNIYFGGASTEKNYLDFKGCRDLNLRVQESAETELTMLRLTNITYYVMGVMLLLRKIILWFLLFVSPFLALLLPFVFIRNVGWIWIGVFFQWLFYGPLFALFLGATSTLWQEGIPFVFNIGRAGTEQGYIYPTAINIFYGAPRQSLAWLKNTNYIDPYAEYIITLIMLWAVTFFPWWLLRIFRDYCCEGIMAMKNVLLAMYDQGRGGTPPGPPGPTPSSLFTGTALKMPQEIEIPIKMKQTVKLEKIEEIRQAKTEDIARSMQISASSLTDVARLETNKESRETVRKNIAFLQNPMKATTPTQRQQFMNIKSELFNRAVKQDKVASRILTGITTSKVEQIARKQEIVAAIPQIQKAAQTKVSTITKTFVTDMLTNEKALTKIATTTTVPVEGVKTVLNAFATNIDKSPAEIVKSIQTETHLEKDKITSVLQQSTQYAKGEAVKVIADQVPLVVEPQKNIEKAIAVPPSVSIEDYEDVKKMWKEQYLKGEVPLTENVRSREQWVDDDVVVISNALNKLLSNDKEMQAGGLDDLGYILPIFMLNNFKPEELLVYLKAKLEAAKEVKEQLAREKELEKGKEEFVEVKATKKEEKAKEMAFEEKLEEEPKKEETPKPPEENKEPSKT